jgi:pyridoxamine 5'-phosphate oxidase
MQVRLCGGAARGKSPAMADPHALFEDWLAEAELAEPNDPNAMALATADAEGRPSVRMVLMKGHDSRGFAFYTNEASRKGEEIADNPRAAILFHWKSLRRQVRAEGAIERTSEAEADSYFATRSRDARIGAWASDQSRPLESRAMFEARYERLVAEHDGKDVVRPPYWRGYRLVPDRIEFWTDRPHRLHERRLFTRSADSDGWSEGLLYP